ncbi:hypothetical protein HY947_04625 [Candidatus Gottesmanbacteria bacterium]|nr:hypothetical protein [Candidatus Gottesmanbacteria bacterium]
MLLQIYSQTEGKLLRPYWYGGQIVSALQDREEYAILVTHGQCVRAQVLLTVDGLNVLTANRANMTLTEPAFMTESYSRGLRIVAWAESSVGGGAFVYTTRNSMSVSAHRNGDPSRLGLIEAMIWTEGSHQGNLRMPSGRQPEVFTKDRSESGGTGVGDWTTQHLTEASPLVYPQFYAHAAMRLVTVADLGCALKKSTARPLQYPPETNFAELSGVPRIRGARSANVDFVRFDN